MNRPVSLNLSGLKTKQSRVGQNVSWLLKLITSKLINTKKESDLTQKISLKLKYFEKIVEMKNILNYVRSTGLDQDTNKV